MLVEAAKDRPCLLEEVGVAGLLWMEVAEGWRSLVGKGLGPEAGGRSDLEKAEEQKRIRARGAEDRVCLVEEVEIRSLWKNTTARRIKTMSTKPAANVQK